MTLSKHISEKDADMTILITGAGGGLGSQIVKGLIDQKHDVVGQYRSKNKELRDSLGVMKDDEFERKFVQAELTDEASVEAMKNHFCEKNLIISTVINLAGSSSNGMSWKLSESEFSRIISNNLLSAFLVCKHFVPDMRARGKGKIINVSSILGSTGAIGASHYCAAKAGVEGFTKSLALELASKNITANVIALGYFSAGIIDTVPIEMQENIQTKTPLKRFGNPLEIVPVIEFLINSPFVTGQTIHINGGLYT